MRVFVLGLRRSGTTIFWSTLKQDRRFAAFNEPYNPLVRLVGTGRWYQSLKRYYEAYHDFLVADGPRFWTVFDAIYETQELQTGFSDRQAAYLDYLLGSSEHALVEETRCHFKAADLAAHGGDGAVLVHLFRSPESFATSHLIPSGQTIRDTDWGALERRYLLAKFELKKAKARALFFRRMRGFDAWGVETVTGGDNTLSLFAHRCRECGLDPAAVYAMPAVGRLMAYWTVCYRRLELDGREAFGERYLPVSFEHFCRAPGDVLGRIYEALGSTPPAFDLSRIHPANPPYRPDDRRWQRYREALSLGDLAPAR